MLVAFYPGQHTLSHLVVIIGMSPETWISNVKTNLKRRQEQLQKLLELERTWPQKVDLNTLPNLQALIQAKQGILNNLETLMRENTKAGMQPDAWLSRLAEGERADIQKALGQIKELMVIILELHQNNLNQLKSETETLNHVLQDVHKEMDMLRIIREAGRHPAHIEAVG